MNTFERVVIEPFERLFEKILQFLPNFLTSLLILVVGIAAAGVMKALFIRIFNALKIDRHLERIGLSEALSKGGIREPVSILFSKAVGWITLFVFIIMSVRALDVPSVEQLLERLFLYLPNIFISVLILFFGYMLSNFFGRAALIASVNAGIRMSGAVAKLVRLTVFLLSVTMSLEQLGIGSETVIIAFAILFGGTVLALSIAFGLGGRDIAKEYLEKKIRGEEKEDEINHL
jgi:Conserved TM helix